jgi:hypothetical protein
VGPHLLDRLQRTGIRKGLLDGSRAWTVVAVVAIGIKLLRRVAAADREVVYRERLQVGESLLITHTTEPRG